MNKRNFKIVNQRGKMTPLRGKTAFNFDPPVFSPAIQLTGGKQRSDNSGNESQGKTGFFLFIRRVSNRLSGIGHCRGIRYARFYVVR